MKNTFCPLPSKNARRCRRAFSLIEILAVVAIISILMAIFLTIAPYVTTKSRETAARSHMRNLAQSLEAFNGAYSYYPPSDADPNDSDMWNKNLFACLLGYKVPKFQNNALTLVYYEELGTTQKGAIRRPFLSPEDSIPTPRSDSAVDLPYSSKYFIDPWDNPYAYRYKTITGGLLSEIWRNPGYILICAGAQFEEPGEGEILGPDEYFVGEMQTTGLIPEESVYFRGNRVDNLTSWKDK